MAQSPAVGGCRDSTRWWSSIRLGGPSRTGGSPVRATTRAGHMKDLGATSLTPHCAPISNNRICVNLGVFLLFVGIDAALGGCR